jgi:hypothetical protein
VNALDWYAAYMLAFKSSRGNDQSMDEDWSKRHGDFLRAASKDLVDEPDWQEFMHCMHEYNCGEEARSRQHKGHWLRAEEDASDVSFCST